MVSATAARALKSNAVVWLDRRAARVARRGASGDPVVHEIRRGTDGEAQFLVDVIREIGDRERIVVLGPGVSRLALERAYVSLYQRPDRLVDVESTSGGTAAELSERLRSADLASIGTNRPR
jgi:stalled ribosome rescue protein Dom34